MVVVDASIGFHLLFGDDSLATAARHRLASEELVAPHLFDAEIVSVARRLALAGTLDSAIAAARLAVLDDFPVERYAHTLLAPRAFELRHSHTAYDAMYVALAEALDCALVTVDRHLAATGGHHATIEVVAAPR